jgi:hypothetical protein
MTDAEWIAEISRTRCNGGPVPVFYSVDAWKRVRDTQELAFIASGRYPALDGMWRDGDVDREKTLAALP